MFFLLASLRGCLFLFLFHWLCESRVRHSVKQFLSLTQARRGLNIKFQIKGEENRRSYSLNSCPYTDEPLQVTVKRMEGGLVSNYINDESKAGHELEVMAPQGRFYADVKKDDYKTYFLFAAGSGITPIFSILKSIMITAPYSVVNLFYGNKNQDTIIFKKELDELKNKYADRLNIVHILSHPKIWATWKQWKGKKDGSMPTAWRNSLQKIHLSLSQRIILFVVLAK